VFLPELESVRGIAILLVFAFHVDGFVRFPFSVAPSVPLSLAFVHAGFTGVDLFFVLSAFLLSLPFLAEGAGGRRVVVREYALRRALRILPLYYRRNAFRMLGAFLESPGNMRRLRCSISSVVRSSE
jgi:peptidoglycan/LPS O-acetylase OafA/YrhL